ncbi:MAG: Crp/Fnr family transcriptional regulator [Acidobacteriaceae bacterium]|nr:Crp/Fnr family transcriptional regulator [Acidobacteriaceae bacterium]
MSSASKLREVIARLGIRSTRRRGECLFPSGKTPTGVYLSVSGRVAVLLERGERAVSQVVGPGTLVGLPAIITGRWFSITAEALDDAEVIFVERQVLLGTLSRDDDLSIQALNDLGRQFEQVRRALQTAKHAVN